MSLAMYSRQATEYSSDTSTTTMCNCCEEETEREASGYEDALGQIGGDIHWFESLSTSGNEDGCRAELKGNGKLSATNEGRSENRHISLADCTKDQDLRTVNHNDKAEDEDEDEDEHHNYEVPEDRDECTNGDEINSASSGSSESNYPISPMGSLFPSFQSHFELAAPQGYEALPAPSLDRFVIPSSRNYGKQLEILKRNRRRLMECREQQDTSFYESNAMILVSCGGKLEAEKEVTDELAHVTGLFQEAAAAQVHSEEQRRIQRENNNREPEDLPHKSTPSARMVFNKWTQVDVGQIGLSQLPHQYSISISTTESQTTVQADENLDIGYITTVTEKCGDSIKTTTTIQFPGQT